MPILMETTLKFDCTRLEDQVLVNANKDIDLDARVTALEGKQTPAYKPTDLDLNTGIIATTYDTTDGLSLTTQGTIKSNNGTDQVVVDYSIPIIGSDTISIDLDQANDKLVFKVDPTANLKGKSFTAEFISGNVTQSTRLNYDGYIIITNPAGVKTFSIPWNYGAGSILTDKYVKTLFGNKSIVGTGNIDLYQHVIKFASNDNEVIMFTVISSKNVNVDSLTDLKTLLGNTFEYPVSGTRTAEPIMAINQTGYATVSSYYKGDWYTYPTGTWTDTVTTV